MGYSKISMGAVDRIRDPWGKLQDRLRELFDANGMSRFAYVDGIQGNDTYAELGSLSYPFATIQGAIDAIAAAETAAAGGGELFTVFVGASQYDEDIVVPNAPATLNKLAIIGTSPDNTYINGQGAGSTITYTPGAVTNLVHLRIENLKIINHNAFQACIRLNCVANTGSFVGGQAGGQVVLKDLKLWNTDADGLALQAFSVGLLELDNFCGDVEDPETPVNWEGIHLAEVSQLLASGVRAGKVQIDFDFTETVTTLGRNANAFVDSLMNELEVNEQAWVRCTKDVQVATVDVNGTWNASGFGQLVFEGTVTGNVTVDHGVDGEGATATVARFDNAHIGGTFIVTGAGKADDIWVTAYGAVFDTVVAGAGIVCDAGDGGAGANIELQKAKFDPESLASANGGTIARDVWWQVEDLSGAGGGTTNVVFANTSGNVPFPDDDYICIYEPEGIPSVPDAFFPDASKTGAQCGITVAAGNGYATDRIGVIYQRNMFAL